MQALGRGLLGGRTVQCPPPQQTLALDPTAASSHRSGGEGTQEPQPPVHPPAALLRRPLGRGRRAPEAGGAGSALGGEGEGPAAAARASTGGGAAGGRGAEGEGLNLGEVPGWSQPPGVESFSCPAGAALPTREKFPRKKCPARREALEPPGAAAR